jgi:hypothetical protein
VLVASVDLRQLELVDGTYQQFHQYNFTIIILEGQEILLGQMEQVEIKLI